MLHTISSEGAGFVEGKKWRKQKVKTEYPPADVLKGMLSIAEFGVAGEPFLWWWS